jgi:hypothetical protein
MSSEPNVVAPECDAEMPDDPFRVRASRVGAHASRIRDRSPRASSSMQANGDATPGPG